MELPDECFEIITFGDLRVGDKFIGLPFPGDNRGHGGFVGAHHIYVKIYPIERCNDNLDNAVRLKTGIVSGMPDSMPVIKVE